MIQVARIDTLRTQMMFHVVACLLVCAFVVPVDTVQTHTQ
jgi:hypothetical protein